MISEAVRQAIPQPLNELAEMFQKAGFPLYGVGGIVRNPLIGYPKSDIDVSSAMPPNGVIKLCGANKIPVIPKGLAFGTVELHYKGEVIEHTTFRADEYSVSGRHRPERVRFTGSLTADAFRRDFSVNALYADILSGEIFDPAGGLEDIENKLIRTTSRDPYIVLRDDGLRIMRMARFAAELGFSVDRPTFLAAKDCAHLLRDISGERIKDELNKILLSDVKYGNRAGVYSGLSLLRDAGAFGFIIPELENCRDVGQRAEHHKYDVMDHCLHVAAAAPPDLVMRLAGLLHDIGKPVSVQTKGNMYDHDVRGAYISGEILRRLKYPNKIIAGVKYLIENHMYDIRNEAGDDALRRHFALTGYENAMKLADLREADVLGSGMSSGGKLNSAARWRKTLDAMRAEGVPFSFDGLNCSGNDIMEWLGIPPSDRITAVKTKLLQHLAVHPEDNNPEKLREKVLEIGR